MMSRLQKLKQRFAEAYADVDASRREIRQASARRLAELLRLTGRRALVAALQDLALTPGDREALARFIAGRLPRPSPRFVAGAAATLRWASQHARYHWRGLAVSALLAVPVVAVTITAVHNTGEQAIQFDQDVVLTFTFGDGHSEPISRPRGSVLVIMGAPQPTLVRLRLWIPSYGYGYADVLNDWFRQHARS
jgi:hypothetical protein